MSKKHYSLDMLKEDYSPILAIFFDAMMAGYAGKNPDKVRLKNLPGSTMIEYQDGPWRVIDIYFVTKSSHHSRGLTLIYYLNTLVWSMQYSGEYHKEAILVLKPALQTAYRSRQFFGGRGPAKFENETGIYNNIGVLGNFEAFSGREHIETFAGFGGYHNYDGGLML